MDHRRLHAANEDLDSAGPVLHWMHREFRAQDNWGLIHAREEALRRGVPVAVVFCLRPDFLDATLRSYDFLLGGLEATFAALRADNIPVLIRCGDPEVEIPRLCRAIRPGLVVTDFDPLRIKRRWLRALVAARIAPVHEVDARNVVPCRIASDHREFSARTLRPKIHRLLEGFSTPFPTLPPHPHSWPEPVNPPDFPALRATLRVDTRVSPVDWLTPGEAAARATLERFLAERLVAYGERNDPNTRVCSDLSPYLHFGMISAQRVLLELREGGFRGEQAEAFIEELVVRRELADNFVLHTEAYDRVAGFPAWAQQTLADHARDPRPHLYDEEQLERAATRDPLWNAAQLQMVRTGKMHSYLRMYWAKKILEWSPDAATALGIAIRQNDRYSLDGRDSNGYTGIAWSIGGVHDRGWTERPVFGKIRYMNDRGAARKFDVKLYIRTWAPAQGTLFPAAGERSGKTEGKKP